MEFCKALHVTTPLHLKMERSKISLADIELKN